MKLFDKFQPRIWWPSIGFVCENYFSKCYTRYNLDSEKGSRGEEAVFRLGKNSEQENSVYLKRVKETVYVFLKNVLKV